MKKIIIPTGYMGSGSSAVTDILQEYQGYEAKNGSYEYIFLHCPNGLFDLEDKLLRGNNALRSDEAIHSFLEMADKLYKDRFWWVADYKNRLHVDFYKISYEFASSITQFQSHSYWYWQEQLSLKRFIQMTFRKVIRFVSAGKINLKRPLKYKPMSLSFPTEEEFYSAAKRYLYKIFFLLGLEKNNLILDQLLLPFNLWRFNNYFYEDTECFVVQRDPRDVFLLNKYVWTPQNSPVPYPTDVQVFCEYYRKMRELEKPASSDHIHRLNFEDLIYGYDATKKQIEKCLGLNPSEHIAPKTKFNPEISINNTQLFTNMLYKKEVDVIEKELPDFLYNFPYEKTPKENQAF